MEVQQQQEAREIALQTGNNIMPVIPRTVEEIRMLAEYVARSNLVPKEYRGRPADVAVAIMHGLELGLKPLQALRNIAVINGRPTVWGDAALALVLASPLCEYVREEMRGEGEDLTAICRVKRRGHPEVVRTFSVRDARRAGLWGKAGPWREYPQRMLQMRARSWALRDAFPDLLSGMYLAEEAMDIPPDDEQPRRIEATAEPVQEPAPANPQPQPAEKPLPKDPQKALEELTKIRAEIRDLLIRAGLSERDLALVGKVFGPLNTIALAQGVLHLLRSMEQRAAGHIKRYLLEVAQQKDLPLTVKDAAAAWEAFLITLPDPEEVEPLKQAFEQSEFRQLMGLSEADFAEQVLGERKAFAELAKPQLRKIREALGLKEKAATEQQKGSQ